MIVLKRPTRGSGRSATAGGVGLLLAVGLFGVGLLMVESAQASPAAAQSTTPSTPSAVLPPTANSSSTLPVLGYTTVTAGRSAAGVRATAVVHGVRRIPGGTVLYYSMGLPAGSPGTDFGSLMQFSRDRPYSLVDSSTLGLPRLVDFTGRKVYSVLLDAQRHTITSPNRSWPTDTSASGRFYQFYEVVPALPADVTKVDVLVGNDVVHDVPVSEGVLQPAVQQTGVLPLGAGWPAIDLAAVEAAAQPQASIRPLDIVSSDIERTVVNREQSGSLTVDLSSDVLFATDSAKLGPAAAGKVQKAADEINQRAAGGRIQIVGHTDNSGSDAYNNDLSRRRASAVLAVLRPLVTVPGASFETAGRGEADPVADNDTADGRRQNRRVSVVFTVKEGS